MLFVLADVDLDDMFVALLCLDVVVDFVKAAIYECIDNNIQYKCVNVDVVDAVCDVDIKG